MKPCIACYYNDLCGDQIKDSCSQYTMYEIDKEDRYIYTRINKYNKINNLEKHIIFTICNKINDL